MSSSVPQETTPKDQPEPLVPTRFTDILSPPENQSRGTGIEADSDVIEKHVGRLTDESVP